MSTAARLEAEAKYPDYTAGGRRDFLAWAKRIQYRHTHGDRSVGKAQIERATEALKNAAATQGEQSEK